MSLICIESCEAIIIEFIVTQSAADVNDAMQYILG